MSKISQVLAQVRPEFDFSSSQDFFEDGALDSFDLVMLIAELDKTYSISIDGMDISPENFANIEKIESLVLRYGVNP